MKRPLLALLFILAVTAQGNSAPPAELLALQRTYDKAVDDIVTWPYNKALTDLNAKYGQALDAAIQEAQKAGRLEDILAIEADKKAVTGMQLPPDKDDDTVPASLKKLRTIYRQQYAPIAAARTTNHANYMAGYVDNIKALESNLTKAGRIEDAKEVMAYRKGLSAVAPPPVAPAAPALEPKVEATPAAPSVSKSTEPSSAVSGNERKIAEYWLNFGGSLGVMDRGKKITVKKFDDLPRGTFKIVTLTLNESKALASFTAKDTAPLAGMEALEEVELDLPKVHAEMDSLTFLATCTGLKKVKLRHFKLPPEFLEYLIPLQELTTFEFTYGSTGTLKLSQLKSKKLTDLSFLYTNVGDDTVAEMASLTNLEDVWLNLNSSLTDACVSSLKGLKKLTRLGLGNTKVTLAGLKELSGLKLERLSFGSKETTDFTEVTRLFPHLLSFSFPRWVKVSPEMLTSFAAGMPKLERIHFWDAKFQDPTCAGFAAFAKLAELDLAGSNLPDEAMTGLVQVKNLSSLKLDANRLTDAALPKLQSMKNLTFVNLTNTDVTAEGLAAFKKARPEVSVTKR